MTSIPEPSPGTPLMPASYGIQSGPGPKRVRWAEAREHLVEARNYWVVTASLEGRPHAVPVWGLWLDESFMFSTDPSSRKGKNLTQNPRLTVHLESGDDAIILEGIAERITDRSVLERFADEYATKYDLRPDINNPEFAFYRLRCLTALAWREKDFPESATRWRFE